MVRARTIREAAIFFREKDPQTCLTETAIRTLLRTGTVPSVQKYLVTVEALETYLMGETRPVSEAPRQAAKRQVWQIR